MCNYAWASHKAGAKLDRYLTWLKDGGLQWNGCCRRDTLSNTHQCSAPTRGSLRPMPTVPSTEEQILPPWVKAFHDLDQAIQAAVDYIPDTFTVDDMTFWRRWTPSHLHKAYAKFMGTDRSQHFYERAQHNKTLPPVPSRIEIACTLAIDSYRMGRTVSPRSPNQILGGI